MNIDPSQISTVISSVPPEAVIGLIVTGLGLSGFHQVVKAKIETDTRKLSSPTNALISIALVALTTAFAQLDGLMAANPQIFGAAFAGLYIVVHLCYIFAIAPFSKWYKGLLDKARALNAQAPTPPVVQTPPDTIG